jgi:hypothetical protein
MGSIWLLAAATKSSFGMFGNIKMCLMSQNAVNIKIQSHSRLTVNFLLVEAIKTR